MNINQTLSALALLLFAGFGGLAAYGLRYVPLVGDGVGNPVTVWDRWEQEVCLVSLIESYPVACSRTHPYNKNAFGGAG